jgi:hypothetical protein
MRKVGVPEEVQASDAFCKEAKAPRSFMKILMARKESIFIMYVSMRVCICFLPVAFIFHLPQLVVYFLHVKLFTLFALLSFHHHQKCIQVHCQD